jgi:hypothetical protein
MMEQYRMGEKKMMMMLMKRKQMEKVKYQMKKRKMEH